MTHSCQKAFKTQIMDASMPGLAYIWKAVIPESRALLPVIEAFEEKHGGRIKASRIDIYKSDGIALRLGITKTPCAVAMKGGRIAGSLTEGITEEALERCMLQE